ncbi:MAG TPA: MBL fold metallo-hydrolase [Planctomycetota bacterium]|nr:MBL fold metallo-hydrolase [Planctomycetota bacterium]
MKIQFWGVRGSIPTPSTADFVTSRYGGNTTCVSVCTSDHLVIFDAGSGLRSLGLALAKEMPVKATFFFSHVHWDHIQGFPFFIPGFVPGNHFDLYGPNLNRQPGFIGSVLERALRGQQESLNFPVQLSDMPAKMTFTDLEEGARIELKGKESNLVVTSASLNHPGGCFGYRVEEHRKDELKTFVYATDTEHLGRNNPKIQKLARNAHVLFYDAQYTEDEYTGKVGMPRKGWGHSTWNRGISESREAGVQHLLLTHHDPLHDDWAVARIENDARKDGLKYGIKVTAAYEGLEISL